MTCGVPMEGQLADEIRAMVRAAAGVELCAAMDAAFSVDPCAGMTDEERANWILGIE